MSRFAANVRTLARLPWRERVALTESTALFWCFVLALKFVPFRRFRRVLGTVGPKHDPTTPRPDTPVDDDIRTVARWMRRIAKRHPDTCLAQALAGRVMLRRRRLPSLISFGVRADESGRWAFHARLVHDDLVLTGGGELARFSVLSTFYDP